VGKFYPCTCERDKYKDPVTGDNVSHFINMELHSGPVEKCELCKHKVKYDPGHLNPTDAGDVHLGKKEDCSICNPPNATEVEDRKKPEHFTCHTGFPGMDAWKIHPGDYAVCPICHPIKGDRHVTATEVRFCSMVLIAIGLAPVLF